MPIIKASHVSKIFETKDRKVQALKDVNFEVEEGDIYGIIGMSGAGKSTLVRCLNFLEVPTEGDVFVGGKNLRDLSENELLDERKQIAMIFQHFNLLMQKNVLDNVCFPLLIQGQKKAAAKQRARELLDIVGLADREKSYPAQLSGGQKQRVAIARALASNPRILLCDEATSALDNVTQKHVSDQLSKLSCTRIVIAHRLSTVKNCDRILVLDHGGIAEQGSYEELMQRKGLFYELVKRQQL